MIVIVMMMGDYEDDDNNSNNYYYYICSVNFSQKKLQYLYPINMACFQIKIVNTQHKDNNITLMRWLFLVMLQLLPYIYLSRNRDCVVRIVTRPQVGKSGDPIPARAVGLYLFQTSGPPLGTTYTLIQE